jgi:hypothetical protein
VGRLLAVADRLHALRAALMVLPGSAYGLVCTHVTCSKCLRWALRRRRNILGGGCAEHDEPCDGTTRSCWQRDLWAMTPAA